MSRNVIRRTVAAVGAAAMVVLGVGLGSGAASAATSVTKTTDNIRVTKSVSPGTVARGATVTYRTVLEVTSMVDRYITKITDVHPAGFEYVPGSAKVTSEEVLSGPKTETPTPSFDNANNRLSVSGNWLASDRPGSTNKDVVFEVTYTVPPTASPGTFDSGVTFDVVAFGTTQVFNPIGVTVDVAQPEIATSTGLTVPGAATVGAEVTLSATVVPAPPGGSVQFLDGGTPIGTPVPVTAGAATLTHTFATAGAHAITAVYSGAGNYRDSASPAITVQVSGAASGGGSGLDLSGLFGS